MILYIEIIRVLAPFLLIGGMNKIVRIALVAEIIIVVCVDYILGLLSKTRVLQYYYMNIRCWLINIENMLLLIIITTLFYLLIKQIKEGIR